MAANPLAASELFKGGRDPYIGKEVLVIGGSKKGLIGDVVGTGPDSVHIVFPASWTNVKRNQALLMYDPFVLLYPSC
jgi:hypothetical protein